MFVSAEFFFPSIQYRHSLPPRNAQKAQQIIDDITSTSVGGECYFIQCDATSLKNVDDACTLIQQREAKINFLFLTAGYMTVTGRDGKQAFHFCRPPFVSKTILH